MKTANSALANADSLLGDEEIRDNIAKTLITALALWAGITIWNIPAMPWLASAGVAGIAIGFAAKDTLANFISGIFIIADAPYRVGDFVNLDNGQRGMVTRIGLRSTRILTRDDVEIAADSLDARVIEVLAAGGAYFAAQLKSLAGAENEQSVVDALWRLTWAGRVTNDTFAPIRSLLAGGSQAHKVKRRAPRARTYRGVSFTGSAAPRPR